MADQPFVLSLTDRCPRVVIVVLLALGALAFHASGSEAHAATFTAAANADAHVDSASPQQNFGGSPTLQVGGQSTVRTYVRFNVEGMTTPVTRARLRFFSKTSSVSGISAQPVADNAWSESAITFANAPAAGSSALPSGGFGAGQWFSIDVTPLVQANGTYSFVLTTTSTNAKLLSSREVAAESPKLVVDTTAPNPVAPSVETQPVPHAGDAADDPAIWVHPTDPSKSTIVGTDKQGGLAVYNLAGKQLHYLPDSTPVNVDVRYGFQLGDQRADLVTTTDRSTNTLRIYRVDPVTRGLVPVEARAIKTEPGLDGLCMYRSAETGRQFVFVPGADGLVQQWELFASGSKVDAKKVRSFDAGSESEACVADDELGYVYVADESFAIRKFDAEPNAGDERTKVDGVVSSGGHLTAHVEGLALHYGSDGTGYLVASSQGSNDFVVYERKGSNVYLKTFAVGPGSTLDGTTPIDNVTSTDGVEVTNFGLGGALPSGAMIVQDDRNDDGNQNFKVIPWGRVARVGSVPLKIDTARDPRATPPPTEGSSSGAASGIFARDSFWNAPLAADVPLDPSSGAYVQELQRQVSEHGPWINTEEYSTPVYRVPYDQPTVRVQLDAEDSDLQAAFDRVPIPPGARQAAGEDGHMVVRERSTDRMWEFWKASKQADGWHARWGGKMTDLSTNPGYFSAPTPNWGATATSLPLLGGLMRLDELKAGRIDHALALAIPEPAESFVWPAQRGDGFLTTSQAIPEGTRFRLPPGLDVASLNLPPVARMMAEAAQRYGIVLRDKAGAVVFFGEDPTPTGTNPYPDLYGGQYPSEVLREFPWGRLQAISPPGIQ